MSQSKDDVSFTVRAIVHAEKDEEISVMEQSLKSESCYTRKDAVTLDFIADCTSEQSVRNISLLDNDRAINPTVVSSASQVSKQVTQQQISEIDKLSLITACTKNECNAIPANCQICKLDGSKKELIKLCNCRIVKLAHLDCLEKQLNDSNIHFCEICNLYLKIERKDKPYSQWWKNRAGLLGLHCLTICILSWIIFPYFMVYFFMKDTKYSFQNASTKIHIKLMFPFILVILLLGYLYGFYLLIFEVHRYWTKWYRNNQDIKLIMYAESSINS